MRELAGQRSGLAAEGGVEMCSVRVGETTFGVPIMRVLEILGESPVHVVPLAPPFIGGLAHYRGEVLTAVSLRSLLDLPPREGASDILVFESGDGYFGLLVDEVGEVMTVPPEALEANPSTVDDRRKLLFAGVCKLQDGLLVILDPDRLDPMRLSR